MESRYSVIRTLRRLTVLVCLTAALSLAQKPVVRIGVIQDGPSGTND